jgi:hypothetical protein
MEAIAPVIMEALNTLENKAFLKDAFNPSCSELVFRSPENALMTAKC